MSRLPRPRPSVALAVALLVGVVHAAAVVGVALWLGYPVGPGDYGPGLAVWRYGGLAVAGAVPAYLLVRRRLVLPAVLLVGVAGFVLHAELTPPGPTFHDVAEFENLDEPTGITVVENGLYAVRYAARWPEWTALWLYAGLAEHAARRYLPVLPDSLAVSGWSLPLARRPALAVAAGLGALHGTVMVYHAFVVDLSNTSPPVLAFVFVGMALIAGVPGYLLVRHRLQVPFALFALDLLLLLRAEFFPGPDGPAPVYLVGWFVFLAIFLLGGGVEYLLRVAGRRFRGGGASAA